MRSHQIFKKEMEQPGCIIRFIRSEKLDVNLLIIVDQEGMISILDAETGFQYKKYRLPCKTEAWTMVLEDRKLDGLSLYVGAATGDVYRYDLKIVLSSANDGDNIDVNEKLVWQHKCNDMITQLQLYDIINNGNTEVVLSSVDHSIRVLQKDTGNLIWGQLFQIGVTKFIIDDIDDDGQLELAASASNGDVRVFSGKNGRLKYYTHFPNNIRTIELIKPEESSLSNNPILVCGCDDYNVYFWDPIDDKILLKQTLSSYPWYSGSFKDQNNKLRIYETIYTFSFMEGLVLEGVKAEPQIVLFDLNPVSVEKCIEGINVQCHSQIVAKSGNRYLCCGTTDGKAHLINLYSFEIAQSLEGDNIINCIDAVVLKNEELALYFCDDAHNLYAFSIF